MFHAGLVFIFTDRNEMIVTFPTILIIFIDEFINIPNDDLAYKVHYKQDIFLFIRGDNPIQPP